MKNELRAYTYDTLVSDIELLKNDFPDLEVGSIGKSVWGREIYYIKIGEGQNVISYNGAHHGMEWITSMILVSFVRDFLRTRGRGGKLAGFMPSALAENSTVYVIPMINPDGVELSANGIPDFLNDEERQRLIEMNEGSTDFTHWQANANGVDLNHNYNALWERSKAMERENGIFGAGRTRFSGEYAESEPESRALADFTREKDFKMTLAFHSQGKVIYHGFMDKEPPYSSEIAKAFTKISPYKIEEISGIASVGGYKDWFVDEFMRPGFTVEVGKGENPLPIECFIDVYRETLPILLGAMTVSLP